MKDYRLYLLDGYSGHIDRLVDFAAPDDERALAIASHRANGQAAELWHRGHKLKHWDQAEVALD